MGIRRACLGAVMICCLASPGASKSLDVIWLSPAEDAVFSPGNTIIAQWTSSSVLVSPGFKLCMVPRVMRRMLSSGLMDRGEEKEEEGEGGRCGTAIWPQVRQVEDGFMVAITAPEAVVTTKYCLEMQDDFGNVFASPVFELGGVSGEGAATLSLTVSATTSESSLETSKPSVDATRHSATLISLNPSPSSTNNNTAVAPPRFGIPTALPQTQTTQPDVLASRRPVSTAAVAVPLSVVSAIILLAGVLGYRTRRALAKDRSRELKSLILSQKDSGSEGYGTVGDVQRAISVLSSRKGCSDYSRGAEPMPPFAARPEPRPTTRDPYYPMMTSVSSGSLYGQHVPVLHYSDTSKSKSLTAQYTAAGTVPCSETTACQTLSFSASDSDIPPSLLPAQMSLLHIRSESPGGDHPLPVPPPPISCLSPSGSTNVYDAIAARLKGHQ